MRLRVLLLSGDDPFLVDFHPDSAIDTEYGTLHALLIDAVSDPIPAAPGWVAELWVTAEQIRRLSRRARDPPRPRPGRSPR